MGDSVMGDFKVLTFSHFIKLSSKEMICISHDPSILQWESWRIRIGSFHPGGLRHEISTIRAHPDPIGTVENSTSMLRWMIGFDLMIKRSMIRILNSDRDSVVEEIFSYFVKRTRNFYFFPTTHPIYIVRISCGCNTSVWTYLLSGEYWRDNFFVPWERGFFRHMVVRCVVQVEVDTGSRVHFFCPDFFIPTT